MFKKKKSQTWVIVVLGPIQVCLCTLNFTLQNPPLAVVSTHPISIANGCLCKSLAYGTNMAGLQGYGNRLLLQRTVGYFDLTTKHMESQRNTELFRKCPEIYLKLQSFHFLQCKWYVRKPNIFRT